jgi:hypothetical protein
MVGASSKMLFPGKSDHIFMVEKPPFIMAVWSTTVTFVKLDPGIASPVPES